MITEQKSTEQMRVDLERYHTIFETATIGIAVATPEGRFFQVNPTFCRFLGYSEEELLKLTIADVTHPHDKAESLRLLHEIRDSGKPGEQIEMRKRYIRKDGQIVWGHTRAGWHFNLSDQSSYVVGLIQDITEQVEAEEELVMSSVRNRGVVDTAATGLITITEHGIVESFNFTAEQIFGYTADEVLDQNVRMLMAEPYQDAHDGYIASYLQTGAKRIIGTPREVVGKRKDGTTFPMELVVNEVEAPYQRLFSSVVREVTAQKRAEAEQRLNVLEQMAIGIAHDINNALSPASLLVDDLLEEAVLSDAVKRDLNTIRTAVNDTVNIIDRLRPLYRPHGAEDELVPIALTNLIEQVIELTRPRWQGTLESRGAVIDIATELQPDVPPVFGLETELREALTNLVFNAIDAMPGGGLITFRAAQDARHIWVEVCDDGEGMDDETLHRCLDPFYSTKSSRGTGLGLAMVYNIIHRHNGDMEIHSEVGVGTTMRLMFPIGPPAESA
jgi:PAS domain S-box-containing protein